MSTKNLMKIANKAIERLGGKLCIYKNGDDYVARINGHDFIVCSCRHCLCKNLLKEARSITVA